MTGVWISECRRSGTSEQGQPVNVAEVTNTQFLSASATSTAFSAVATTTKWLRVYADANMLVAFNQGAAVQASVPIASHLPEYFACVGGTVVTAKTQ